MHNAWHRAKEAQVGFFDGIDDALDEQHKTDQEAFDAPKFDPEPGDNLQGVLLKAEPFTKGKFGATVLLSFRNVGEEAVGGVEAGESGVLFCPTVLRRKLIESAPAIGTPFALRFEGKVTPEKGGNPYKDWTLLTSYQKTGDASEVDQPLWNNIQSKMGDDEPRGDSGNTVAEGDSGWKF